MSLITLKKRLEFINSNKKAVRFNSKNLIIQKLKKDKLHPFFGFTVTKKIGTAVIRNKIKRRLKSIIRMLLKNQDEYFNKSFNYVLICKKDIVKVSYNELRNEIKYNFKMIKNKYE
tara:strand:- start:289 stop:636 length:348 start_codon:yes stop_codon:yes gene_type:complete